MNLMTKADFYIAKEINEQIKALSEQMICSHEWYYYAVGFKCAKCDYYTGYDNELNKLIKPLRKVKQPS